MFRHVNQPTIAPIVRSAFIFGLASALLLGSLHVKRTLAAPQTVARDPQALTLIASSLKPLTGPVAVNDITLQATVAYVAGSDEETGTATLTARGNQESLVQLNLSGGSRACAMRRAARPGVTTRWAARLPTDAPPTASRSNSRYWANSVWLWQGDSRIREISLAPRSYPVVPF